MRMRALLIVPLVIVPGVVRGQQCATSAQIGHIGITSLECTDCLLAPPTRSTQWRFGGEPRILRLDPRGPAQGRLQEGDVIVSVNGNAITTEAGAALLARPPRNSDIVLRVRRDGRVQQVTVRTTGVCPTDSRALGPAPTARGQAATPPVAATVGGGRVMAPTSFIGLAFSCGDCAYGTRDGNVGWTFRTPPEVYSVEPGSPAYSAGMRRGDVLTHVDGLAITSAEGGRRWGSLRPGEQVQLRYRRDGSTRNATIRVSSPRNAAGPVGSAMAREWVELQASLAERDSSTQRLLQQYEQNLRAQQTLSERMLRELRERGIENAADRRTYTQQEQLLRRLTEEVQSLARQRQTEAVRDAAVQRELEQLLATAKVNPTVQVAPAPITGTQRYASTFAGVEIEVRGGNPVIVSEQGDELVIRMADGSTVTLRRSR